MGGIVITEFVRLKPKYSRFLWMNIKVNGVNKNAVVKIISHNKYKDALLSKKMFKPSNE